MEQALEIIGVMGVFMILAAYFLLQRDTMKAHDLSYLWLNLIGSLLILLSLITAWNLPAFIIEVAWIAISLYGILKTLKRKEKPGEQSQDDTP